MWSFKKQKKVSYTPRLYFDVTVKLNDGEILEFKAYDIVAGRGQTFINFQTTDGWIEIDYGIIRYISTKQLNEKNVVPLRPEVIQ